MSQQDTQWPSEDEDFDAVSNGKTFTVEDFADNEVAVEEVQAPQPQPKPVERPSTSRRVDIAKSVTVISDNQPEAEVEQQEPEQPEEVDEVEQAFNEEPIETHQTYTPEVETTEVADEELSEPEYDEEQFSEQPESDMPQQSEPQPAQTYAAPAEVTQPKQPKVKKDRAANGAFLRGLGEIVLIIAIAALGLWAWTLYSDNKDLKNQVTQLNQNPQIAVEKQTNNLIASVGAHMNLPNDEQPTVANVSDAEKAKLQSSFFNDAQNGDKVLMYVKAGEAILYRPTTDKVVLVAPLTFNNNQASSTTKTNQ